MTSLLFPNCSDTYCHTFAVDCAVDSCDYSFTHESMTYGPVNTSVTYTEDHIDLHFAPFDDGLGGGPTLGNAYIDYAIPGIGTNQVLLLSNINADYDLTNLVNVSRVTFDYFDGAGIENLMVQVTSSSTSSAVSTDPPSPSAVWTCSSHACPPPPTAMAR